MYEDRGGKLMTNYALGNQVERFPLNSQPHLPTVSQTFTRQRVEKSAKEEKNRGNMANEKLYENSKKKKSVKETKTALLK